MKKSTKLQFLAIGLLLMLFQQNQYANNDDVNQAISVCAGAAAGLTAAKFKLSGFGILSCANYAYAMSIISLNKSTPHNQYCYDTLPHLQPWYANYLAKKYPLAYFDKKELYVASGNAADHKRIYIDYYDALAINDIHKKQITNQNLTQKESEKLSEIEWIMLHEATHVNNHDFYTQNTFHIGATVGLELAYQQYKKSQPVAPISNSWAQAAWKLKKSLPKRAAILGTMYTTYSAATSYYSRHCEARADAFANQHADLNALKAASLFLMQRNKIIKQSEYDTTQIAEPSDLFQSHPRRQSRIQNIEDEIKRRETNN